MTESFWTDARIEHLKSLINDGLSFALIAARIGTTRNACIGKAGRLGLSNPNPRKPLLVVDKKLPPQNRPLVIKPAEDKAAPMTIVAHKPISSRLGPIKFGELTERYCRWPIGEGRPFEYCGADKAEGCSYCSTHKAMAYTPAFTRSERQRFVATRQQERAAEKMKMFTGD